MSNSWFFQNDKEKKIFTIYIIGFALLGLLLVVLFVIIPKIQGLESQSTGLKENQGSDYQTRTIILSDFIINDAWQNIFKPTYYLFRQKLKKWGKEQIARH